jgi:hypothetical protein
MNFIFQRLRAAFSIFNILYSGLYRALCIIQLHSIYWPIWLIYLHVLPEYLCGVRNKPEGRGFDSRWCHWNFALT